MNDETYLSEEPVPMPQIDSERQAAVDMVNSWLVRSEPSIPEAS
jgi:hypothetical protein